MKLLINGTEHELADGSNVREVLDALGMPRSNVAVALDGDVIPRSAWEQTTATDGAVVEVVTAVQGG